MFEVGRLLIAAKKSLGHGGFEAMCARDLPFKLRMAEMYMAVARDERLQNPQRVALLPPSIGTVYDLTRLKDVELDQAFERKVIRPDMERKDAINGARAVMASRQHPSGDLDYFPTPPWATRALMERVLPQLPDVDFGISEQSCWEPACGEGHIAEVLSEYFRQVIPSDVHNYGYHKTCDTLDFLATNYPPPPDRDWIITNPPFEEKGEQFVLRALDLANVGVAMFVRLQWLETTGRYERIFKDRPPTLIAFFAERVNLCKDRWDPEGTTATAYIWLVWIKDRSPQAPFWIPPGCREALTRDDDVARFTAHPVIRKSLSVEAAE